MNLQIIKLDESKPKKIVSLFIAIIALTIVSYSYDLINDRIFGALLILLIIGLIIAIRVNKKIINIGSMRIFDNRIEIKTINDFRSFEFDSLIRLKFTYKGIEDDFKSLNFMFLVVSNGINSIEILDKDNNEFRYDFLIKNFRLFKSIKNKLIEITKTYPNIIEMVKD